MKIRIQGHYGWGTLRLAALVAVSVAGCAWLASTVTSARNTIEFDNSALQGAYAVVGTGGANDAASVGVTKFDGAGGATRVLVLNEADPNSSGRLVVTIPATGTYSVSANGTGTAVFTNVLPDGSKLPFSFDFVITDAYASVPRRSPLATKLHMVQREPGIAAKLVVFDLTRLPN